MELIGIQYLDDNNKTGEYEGASSPGAIAIINFRSSDPDSRQVCQGVGQFQRRGGEEPDKQYLLQARKRRSIFRLGTAQPPEAMVELQDAGSQLPRSSERRQQGWQLTGEWLRGNFY